jgi:tRNA (adenine57-N1/adenine58-N1)-methyltransferase
MRVVTEGEIVLLYLNEKKKWLVQARSGKEFHTHVGVVKLEEIVGSPFGSSVKSTLGFDFHILFPTIRDQILSSRRPTQVLYDKDIGFVLFRLGVTSGSVVIEAGTGSGAMTASLANAVKPEGHVYSYEIRSEFAEIASRNLARLRLEKYVTIKNADARAGFGESDVDAIFVDLGDPWDVIASVHAALKGGHPMASFSPTVNQIERTVQAMKGKFVDVETLECLVRNMRVEEGRTRPATTMIGHTGYLTFARKILERSEPSVRSAT